VEPARTARAFPRTLAAASLALALVAVYAPVVGHDYLNYDDDLYVTANPVVRAGLSWAGARWAFTTFHSFNWHPLTWLSLMLDSSLLGLEPGPRHAMNALLHALNTSLLYLTLARLTGARGRSLAVASLFALHPVQVEPVAWISARKDLLAALCFLLALWAYAGSAGRERARAGLGVFAAFAAGLLCKPVVVTLPFVLLLLDAWPLRRLDPAAPGAAFALLRLAREKWPLFGLAAASSVVFFEAQRQGGAVVGLEAIPLGARLANAAVAYVGYLAALVWPAGLAIHYPFRDLTRSPAGTAFAWACAAALAALSWGALRALRRAPYLAVGWLWFLGMLVPMIGVVQLGAQASADRYLYLPSVGLFVAAVWGAAALGARRPRLLLTGAVAASAALGASAALQIRHWRSSETVFARALAVTEQNGRAHLQLGAALLGRGEPDAAFPHALEAVRLEPGLVQARNNLAMARAQRGELAAAIAEYRELLRRRPDWASAHNNLGVALAETGRFEEAAGHFREALRLDPGYENARRNLADSEAAERDAPRTIAVLREALRREPEAAELWHRLALLLLNTGDPEGALLTLQDAVGQLPGASPLRFNLALLLAGRGRAQEAIAELRDLLRRDPQDVGAQQGLAALLERSSVSGPAEAAPAPGS
jgi:tetratricopeptide (TPR) repeat protein